MPDLPTINRTVVTLVPTVAYLEWAKSCPDGDPNMELDEVQADSTAYLIPEDEIESDERLRPYYRAMLTEELWSWCTDPAFWPADLSFQKFNELFTIRVSSLVFDLGAGRIEKDDEDE